MKNSKYLLRKKGKMKKLLYLILIGSLLTETPIMGKSEKKSKKREKKNKHSKNKKGSHSKQTSKSASHIHQTHAASPIQPQSNQSNQSIENIKNTTIKLIEDLLYKIRNNLKKLTPSIEGKKLNETMNSIEKITNPIIGQINEEKNHKTIDIRNLKEKIKFDEISNIANITNLTEFDKIIEEAKFELLNIVNEYNIELIQIKEKATLELNNKLKEEEEKKAEYYKNEFEEDSFNLSFETENNKYREFTKNIKKGTDLKEKFNKILNKIISIKTTPDTLLNNNQIKILISAIPIIEKELENLKTKRMTYFSEILNKLIENIKELNKLPLFSLPTSIENQKNKDEREKIDETIKTIIQSINKIINDISDQKTKYEIFSTKEEQTKKQNPKKNQKNEEAKKQRNEQKEINKEENKKKLEISKYSDEELYKEIADSFMNENKSSVISNYEKEEAIKRMKRNNIKTIKEKINKSDEKQENLKTNEQGLIASFFGFNKENNKENQVKIKKFFDWEKQALEEVLKEKENPKTEKKQNKKNKAKEKTEKYTENKK